MQTLFTLSFVLISAVGFGQTYNFKPQWKQGDVKTILVEQTERDYEDGELVSDETTYNDGRIEVLKDDKDSYTVEVLWENQALAAAVEFYEKLETEMTDFRDLRLIYRIDKTTAEAELQNWKDAQKFMSACLDQIVTVFEREVPDVAPFVEVMFSPIKGMFESKETIEAYMAEHIGYILAPYNRDFTVGQTQSTTETGENPLNPMTEVSLTTHLTLQSVDEVAKTCVIHQEVEIDLSEFIALMKSVVQNMVDAFEAEEDFKEEKNKEMDAFEMDIENLQVTTFDYASSWVTEVVATVVVSGTDPKSRTKNRKESTTTITFK